MVAQHWIPGFNSRSSGLRPINPAKHDSDADAGCQRGLQRALCPGPPAVMALSAVCGVLLLVSVVVSMLYHGSENKREGLLSEYQNLSDQHLNTTEANRQLRAQNLHLQQHNTWLIDQSTRLNTSFATLAARNRALTSASIQLPVQLTNLTSTYDLLLRDHGQLVQDIADLENTSRNASRTVSSLVRSHAELEAERRNLSDINTFLREELIRANVEREELAELNSELGAHIENLTATTEEEDAMHREDSQQRFRDEQSMIAELQGRNRNLSALLEQQARGAAERERGAKEEKESMEQAYGSLDRYCPVVNWNTNERVCKTCPESWRLFQTTCYYFSSRTLTWAASRTWCRTQGGDLLVVNTKQEQSFIFTASQRPDHKVARLWIGMTDAAEEGQWLWVDRSPLSSDLQFWLNRPGTGAEPDNWRAENTQGEDCGHIDTNEEDLSSWMDGSCDFNYRWICERSV